MRARLLTALPFVALAFSACTNTGPGAGAAKVVVEWKDFQPGCVTLSAASGDKSAEPTRIALDGKERTGSRTIAVYRAEGWGSDVQLTARGYEGACDGGKVVSEAKQTVAITNGKVDVTLSLTAADVDQDGFVDAHATLPGTDCDDAHAEALPGGTESCDGLDNNCDGTIDEGFNQVAYYRDSDNDGHGTSVTQVTACAQPPGYVTSDDDCDDAVATTFTGATETCNGVDDNCDGTADEGLLITYFRDGDSDGFGVAGQTTQACSVPAGYSENDADCDDADPEKAPDRAEVCDAKDNNCNGTVDEGVKTTFYNDGDGDSYGNPLIPIEACAVSPGVVADNTDCNDALASIHPGAAETCNDADDNCNMQIDEGVKLTFYEDADNDTYGTAASTTQACTVPTGYSANNTDCDDTRNSVHPNGTETCNGLDDDCDGTVDDGVLVTVYRDADLDGEGDSANTSIGCPGMSGYVGNSTDCDDGNPFRGTAIAEVCDGLDNNCNTTVDDGVTCTAFAWKTPSNNGGNGHDWKAVTAFARDKAYAVGHDDSNFANSKVDRYEGTSRTANWEGDCNGPMYSAWASPVTETLYIGRFANYIYHQTGTTSCGGSTNAPSNNSIRGLVGLTSSLGIPALYGASTAATVQNWDAVNGTATVIGTSAGSFWSIHGLSTNNVVAVGDDGGSTTYRPLIFERKNSTTWTAGTLPNLSSITGDLALRDVSMAPSGFVMAVGDKNLVLTRTATGAWTKVDGPPNGTSLLAVKTFGSTLAYVAGTTATTSELWRWTGGNNWTLVSGTSIAATDSPRDLDGTASDDLWLVGDNGLIRHWHN